MVLGHRYWWTLTNTATRTRRLWTSRSTCKCGAGLYAVWIWIP